MDAPDELEGELAAGERVGRVAVLRDGKVVKRVPLVTAAEVPGAGPLRVISEELGGALITLIASRGPVRGGLVGHQDPVAKARAAPRRPPPRAPACPGSR